jgi:hypothetical protein
VEVNMVRLIAICIAVSMIAVAAAQSPGARKAASAP